MVKDQALNIRTLKPDMIAALRSMGYGNRDMTAHGFRGMAATILTYNDFPSHYIYRQLGLVERNPVRIPHYDDYLPQRREMMQHWADWLDSLRDDKEIREE